MTSPSGRSGCDGTQSTASTRLGGRSSPSSSSTSRRHAACGDSSASTAPPGRSHSSLYTGSTSSTRPATSRKNALAAIRLRASDATYCAGGSTSTVSPSLAGRLSAQTKRELLPCRGAELQGHALTVGGVANRHALGRGDFYALAAIGTAVA